MSARASVFSPQFGARLLGTVREPWCTGCGAIDGVAGHNLRCAANGERSYSALPDRQRSRRMPPGVTVVFDAAHALTTVIEFLEVGA